MGLFLVMKAEFVRGITIMRRYWFATLIGMVIGYGMLVAMILGFTMGMRGDDAETPDGSAQVTAPIENGATAQADGEAQNDVVSTADTVKNAFGENAVSKALGFIIGMFAFSIVGMFTSGMQGMARTGELEQVYMSPHGLVTNFLARSLMSAIMSIIPWSIMLVAITYTFKATLHFDGIPTIVVIFLSYFNLVGFGFMAGGLVLVFKQIGQVTVIVRLVFLFIALAVTAENLAGLPFVVRMVMHVVPISDAAVSLKLLLVEGLGWGIFAHPSFFFLVVNCVTWTMIGISLFRVMESYSRDKGTLGAY